MCYFLSVGYAGHDERRERILSAAAALLAKAGMERLSVRSVADAAGIGMGTLRHYFPNQKSLHDALILRLVDDETNDFRIHDTQVPPRERLEACVLQFLPAADESAHLLDVWFGMYRVGLDPQGAPFARQFLEVSTTRSRERLREWLGVLAAEGHLDRSAIDRLVLHLSALISGACLEMVTPGAEMTLTDAQSVLRNAVRMIVKETSQ